MCVRFNAILIFFTLRLSLSTQGEDSKPLTCTAMRIVVIMKLHDYFEKGITCCGDRKLEKEMLLFFLQLTQPFVTQMASSSRKFNFSEDYVKVMSK